MGSAGSIYKIKTNGFDEIEKDVSNCIFDWNEGFEKNREIFSLATNLEKKGEAISVSRACYPDVWLVKARDIFPAIQERITYNNAAQFKVYGEIKYKQCRFNEALLESCKPDELVYLEYWEGL